MKKNKYFLKSMALLIAFFTITGCSDNNSQYPYIGENGNWWIDETDLGFKANGEKGKDGSSLISGIGVPQSSVGSNGDSYIDTQTWDYYIKTNGEWVKSGNLKGDTGEKGDAGVSIVSINLTSSLDNIDTYSIIYSDGSTSYFKITNGSNGEKGIQGIPGENGHSPIITIGEDGFWYVDGISTGIKAQGEKGEQGENGSSAYEIFIKYHPDYMGTEEDWINDVANGNHCNLFGHSYIDTVIEPTCQKEGYTKHYCSYCDYEYTDSYTNKIDHNYIDLHCTMCGALESLNADKYIQDTNGWVIAIMDNNYYLTDYLGDGVSMTIPKYYNDNLIKFDYFDIKIVFNKYKDTLEYLDTNNFNGIIPVGCFSAFSKLKTAIIGDHVTAIERFAFYYCDKLERISIGENVESIGDGAFIFCYKLCYIRYKPKNANLDFSTNTGDLTNNWSGFLQAGYDVEEGITLEIADSVISLPDKLFRSSTMIPQYHPNIKNVIVSQTSKLESIGSCTFEDCVIDKFYLPKSLKSIEIDTFLNGVVNNIYYYGSEEEYQKIQNINNFSNNIYYNYNEETI